MIEPWPRGRARHGGIDEVPVPAEGRLWLAGKRYVAPDPAGAAASVTATTVVCLCESFELEERWPHYVDWLEAAGASAGSSSRSSAGASPGVRALWWPIPDLHAPPAESARGLVAEITTRLDAGEGVLVHCGAGMGRAGTVAAAVLMHYGLTAHEAVAAVAGARPGAGPEVGAQTDLLARLGG